MSIVTINTYLNMKEYLSVLWWVKLIIFQSGPVKDPKAMGRRHRSIVDLIKRSQFDTYSCRLFYF